MGSGGLRLPDGLPCVTRAASDRRRRTLRRRGNSGTEPVNAEQQHSIEKFGAPWFAILLGRHASQYHQGMIPRRQTAWLTTAMSVFFGGNDATRSVQRPTFHVHDRLGLEPDAAADSKQSLYRGGSAAALHRRCLAALLIGNSRPGTDRRLHAQTARQLERRLPQGVRQAGRSVRFGEVVAGAATW